MPQEQQSPSNYKQPLKGMNSLYGIYYIKNIVTNKYYIGSTFDFNKRFTAHRCKLNNNRHHSIKLQNSWNKHGKNNFEFKILEVYYFNDEMTSNYKKHILESAEQSYFEKFNCVNNGYNVAKIAGTPCTKRSKESIDKQKNTVKERGWFRSEESKLKSKITAKNSEHIKFANKLIGLSMRKPVYQYNSNGDFVKKFNWAKDAAIELNVCVGTIAEAARLEKDTVKSFKFTYNKVDKIAPYTLLKNKHNNGE